MMSMPDITALLLTAKLALITTSILIIAGLPIAWAVSRYSGKLKPYIEAIIALPLVLPPTVLGYYCLVAFAPDSAFGGGWLWLTGEQLAFSFSGILIGSCIYSLPFVLQPLIVGFSNLSRDMLDASATLGLGLKSTFQHLVLPVMKPAILTAATLGFAHTLGEFGLVLMIGGNIPGETQVLSLALYDHVEMLNYQAANQLAFILLAFSFLSLVLLYRFNSGYSPLKGLSR